MIVAIGVDVDVTFATFVHEALKAGAEIECINLRVLLDGEWRFGLPHTEPAVLRYAGKTITLAPEDGYYCRPIDLSGAETDPTRMLRWRSMMTAVRAWLDAVPGTVANRPSSGHHNSSKPLHETLLRDAGMRVPESVTSSDPNILRAFVSEGPCISKTVCGVRADTEVMSDDALAGFRPSMGPLHLQRRILGADARIHVAGDQVIAQKAQTDAVDYRRAGAIEDMDLFDPPDDLKDCLITATRSIGLAFAGWDFKIDDDENYWCLEANPMPGYSPYDAHCGGAISRAVRRLVDPHSL